MHFTKFDLKKLSIILLLFSSFIEISFASKFSENYIKSIVTIHEPMLVQLLPQSSDMVYTNVNLSYSIKTINGKYAFEIYYLNGNEKVRLVDFSHYQLNQEIYAVRTAELVIERIKTDKPLEISGAALNTIFK